MSKTVKNDIPKHVGWKTEDIDSPCRYLEFQKNGTFKEIKHKHATKKGKDFISNLKDNVVELQEMRELSIYGSPEVLGKLLASGELKKYCKGYPGWGL